jgi:hypothetical protein
MSQNSRLNIRISDERAIVIYGVRSGRAFNVSKAIHTTYRGWVLMLTDTGRIYSPNVIGRGSFDARDGRALHCFLVDGLLALGAITQAERDAINEARESRERHKELRRAMFELNEAARILGVTIPKTMERKISRAVQ